MARGEAAALEHFDPVRERLLKKLKLLEPATPQVAQSVVLERRKVPLGAEDALEPDWVGAQVLSRDPALEQVEVLEHPVVQGHSERVMGVLEHNLEYVALDLKAAKLEHRIAHPVCKAGLEAGFAVGGPSVGRILLEREFAPAVEGTPLTRVSSGRVVGGVGQPWSPVAVNERAAGVDSQRVGGAAGLENPGV